MSEHTFVVRPSVGDDDHDITGLSPVGDLSGCGREGRFRRENFCRSSDTEEQ